MDGTFLDANNKISEKNARLIISLLKHGVEFAVISGVSKERIDGQFINPLLEFMSDEERDLLTKLHVSSDSGTQIYKYDNKLKRYKCVYSINLKEFLTKNRYEFLRQILYDACDELNLRGKLQQIFGENRKFSDAEWEAYKSNCFDERGIEGTDVVTQVAFMVIGKTATSEEKTIFNENGGKQIREEIKEYVDKKLKEKGISLEVKVSGKSSIDITRPHIHKGTGINKIVTYLGWDSDSVIFFGDALGQGKNDEPAMFSANFIVNVGKKVEKFWKIYNSLPELADIMLFLMRDDIKPMWEDERNKNGGAYLYKIHNNKLSDIWTEVSCAVIGETLHTNFEMSKKITGISISPKFQTTTLRVWVADLNVEAKDFCLIGDGLEQPIFKKH